MALKDVSQGAIYFSFPCLSCLIFLIFLYWLDNNKILDYFDKNQHDSHMARKAFGKDLFFLDNYPIIVFKVEPPYPFLELHDLDFTQQQHYHDFSELVIATEGTGLHWVEGFEFHVAAGDVFFIQGEQQHFFKELNDLTIYNVLFQADRLRLPTKELKKIPGFNAIFVLEPVYRQKHNFKSRLHLDRSGLAKVQPILRQMWREVESPESGFEVSLFGNLIQLLVILSRQYSEVPQTAQGQAILRIAKVIGALEKEYASPWKLSDLADLAHMSEGNLHRVFKEATGQSPIDYVIQLRLHRAMEMLSETMLSITEIAFEVGFKDSNYFTRQFKKMTGISPSRYRGSKP